MRARACVCWGMGGVGGGAHSAGPPSCRPPPAPTPAPSPGRPHRSCEATRRCGPRGSPPARATTGSQPPPPAAQCSAAAPAHARHPSAQAHTGGTHQTRRRVPRQKTKQGLGLAGSAPNWRERGESCTSTQCSESGFLGFFTSVRGEFARGECAGSRRAAGRLLGENGAGERGGESSVAEPRAEVDSTAPTETDVGRPRLVRSGV